MTETEEALKTKASTLECQRNKLQDELAQLRDEFYDMKYTGESKHSA